MYNKLSDFPSYNGNVQNYNLFLDFPAYFTQITKMLFCIFCKVDNHSKNINKLSTMRCALMFYF